MFTEAVIVCQKAYIKIMEKSVRTGNNQMKPEYTVDVMEIMTKLRKEWGMTYPEEEMNEKRI